MVDVDGNVLGVEATLRIEVAITVDRIADCKARDVVTDGRNRPGSVESDNIGKTGRSPVQLFEERGVEAFAFPRVPCADACELDADQNVVGSQLWDRHGLRAQLLEATE